MLIILAGCFWGSMGIFVRRLAEYGFNSMQIVSIRVTLAALIFALVLFIKDRAGFKISPGDIPLFLFYKIKGWSNFKIDDRFVNNCQKYIKCPPTIEKNRQINYNKNWVMGVTRGFIVFLFSNGLTKLSNLWIALLTLKSKSFLLSKYDLI